MFLKTERAPSERLTDCVTADRIRVSSAVTEKLVAHKGVPPSSLTGMFLQSKWAKIVYLVG